MSVAFFAPGTPQTQGNKTAIVRGGRAVLVEGRRAKSRNAFTEWRATVRLAASDARADEPLEGPLSVRIHFALPRPKSAPKRRRTWPTGRLDLDKLTRAVLDAVTEARVWVDDGQVVHVDATKDYPDPRGEIGAWVRVVPVDERLVPAFDIGNQLFVRTVSEVVR